MTRNEALKNALNHLRHVGLIENYKDAALKMGADPSNISRYINGAKVSDKFLRRFNDAFGNIFRMEYLSEGEGEMLRLGALWKEVITREFRSRRI